MDEAELDRIQSELRIELPSSYRESMSKYPIPACAGNVDTYLWDSATDLIQANLSLREGTPWRVPAWPSHVFFLGYPEGATDGYAIDLRQPEGPVYWVDHFHLDLSEGPVSQSFAEWAKNYVRDFTRDLESDGVDPQGLPRDRDVVELANARSGCWTLVLLAVGVAILLIVLFAVMMEAST